MTGKLHLETMHAIPYVASRSTDIFIRTAQDMLEILAWGSERGTYLYLFQECNFSPEFFDLSTGLAGEILQKCSNYHVRLAIAGDYTLVMSSRFGEFVVELNRGNSVRFTPTRVEAADWLVDSDIGP